MTNQIPSHPILLGVDTGGTFTDFVCIRGEGEPWQVHKVLSTPGQPQQAIQQGIAAMGLEQAVNDGRVTLVHGTTVATNAALEGKGVKTAYITNRGLKDVLQIGRQVRQELYNLSPQPQALPISEELLFEVEARLDSEGKVVANFEAGELETLKQAVAAVQPESVAINLLFSFKDASHEQAIEALFDADYFVSRSSAVLPEYKEYERGVTTWVNAWLGPLIRDYLKRLIADMSPAPVSIMQSSGLTISADQAADRAVNLLLSGPAGGLAAAQSIGEMTDTPRLMTFDMGGTSTDVALIEGQFNLTNAGRIAGLPIGIPMADIHTIGAGGGSIAYVDDGGLLRVGPRSAGAFPGPACYDRGGDQPTVTDANLVLGKLSADRPLADGLTLNLHKAEQAIDRVATHLGQTMHETAQGIIDIANEHMSQALRVISVQKGHDPREFTLMCFGGAGGLHLCDLADSLEMTRAMVPIHGGVLSALGMLTTTPGRELVQTLQLEMSQASHQTLQDTLDQLSATGQRELRSEGIAEISRSDSVDLRYQGQTFTLNLPLQADAENLIAAFHEAHEHQYGHRMERPVEVVNCRVHLQAVQSPPVPPRLSERDRPLTLTGTVDRKALMAGDQGEGPILINESHSTTYVKAGWAVRVDDFGHLMLKKLDLTSA